MQKYEAAPPDSAMTSPPSCTPRNLLSLKDAPWRWAAGAQAALANALPMVIFYLSGHLSLGIISSLGSFTVLYGTTMRLRERVRVLPLLAAAFVTASLVGVLCSASAGLMLACVVIVALTGSILVFGLGLGPPGPMQFVLVTCVSARLAVGTRAAPTTLHPNLIPVLVAVGALSACVVVAPLALRFVRSDLGNTSAPETLFALTRLDAGKLLITARLVLAVATADIVGSLFRAGHTYWIVMVAGAVLQATWVSRDTVVRIVHRILGTLAGVAVFGLIRFFDPRGGWLILVLVILQFAIELVVARHYAVALTFITPTALTIAAFATSAPGTLVEERIVDTILGALIALVVLWTTNWVCKPHRASGLRHSISAQAFARLDAQSHDHQKNA